MIHAGLLGVLMLMALPAQWIREQPAVDTVEPTPPAADHDPVEPIDVVDHESPDDPAHRQLPRITERLDALADVDPSSEAPANLVQRQLAAAQADADAKTQAEKMADLEALGRRLSNVSTEESLQDALATIAPMIGANTDRATAPVEGLDDSQPFDLNSAQISDVLKTGEDADVQYVAVMVDANGRSQEMPMDVGDGETLYEAFQLMKKFSGVGSRSTGGLSSDCWTD